MEICEHCNGTKPMADEDTGWSYCEITIHDTKMLIDAGRYNETADFEIDIKFCPMCGRELK